MQTHFSAAQLADPDLAECNDTALRRCVHCGFCNATCPTFVLTGDELDGPRGRILLMQNMLESGKAPTKEVVLHIDRCLSCLACMTTCPSGVNYMHLVDHARAYIERNYRRPLVERTLRRFVAIVLPRPRLFRIALGAARLARPLRGILPEKTGLGGRIKAMLALAPARLPPSSSANRPQVFPALGQKKARVALLAGCAQQVLAPAINESTIRLLTRLGVEVVVTKGVGCCGALVHHMGRHADAVAAARRNVAAWQAERSGAGLDAIVATASGCGTMLKEYGFLLRNEPEGKIASEISNLCVDVSEFVERIGYAPTRPDPGMRIVYHGACSLQHGQHVHKEPIDLLRRAGFTVVEPAEPHLCCGSAGTYNLLQPEFAGKLRERKLSNLAATKAVAIAAGNIGCMTQLASEKLPIAHPVELLDWMAGGPKPAALGALSERG